MTTVPKYMLHPDTFDIFTLNSNDTYSNGKNQILTFTFMKSSKYIEVKDDEEMDDLHYYIGQARSLRGL